MFSLKKNFRIVSDYILPAPSIIIELKDEFTGTQPFGQVDMLLKDFNLVPYKNASGYYLLYDLPEGEYVLQINSEFYFNMEVIFSTADYIPPNNILSITLEVKPSYPFTYGTTLIRGIVYDADNKPINGAVVEILNTDYQSLTTNKGEFVLFIINLKEDDIVIKNNKKIILINGSTTMHIRASYNSVSNEIDLLDVEEGKVSALEMPIIL